ncbi:MAG: SOS response-associated peptidase [Pseudomonadota bacterium]|uniref:SOS response-associated peptidase n=1 Tax=Fodinicurvata fenggangensis TaxID=1121830 RepID=UPI00047ABC71|nr:SOS response-associated peptidase [Fodinicurvata fenggangensis]
MCGRYYLLSPAERLRKLFRLETVPQLRPRANIAPGSAIPAVRNEEGSGAAFFAPQWGLVPAWAKDQEIALRLKNARCESAPEKPAFREAWQRRRCLIPADGFLEWPEGRGPKQPYGVRHREGELLVFAGLWERWYDPAQTAPRALESCTILTTAARGALRSVHHRMPVMLQPQDYDDWLDPTTSGADLATVLDRYPEDELAIDAFPQALNDSRVEDPSLLRPIPQEDTAPLQGSLF